MKSEEGIHVLARAVIVEDNKLLVTTDIKSNVSFLPGGHVNYGEKIQDGLLRELQEELGYEFKLQNFLGVIEAGWDHKGELYHEVNLIFLAIPTSNQSLLKLESQEEKLRLEWISFDQLASRNLYPELLRKNIPQWLESTSPRLWSEWTWKNK